MDGWVVGRRRVRRCGGLHEPGEFRSGAGTEVLGLRRGERRRLVGVLALSAAGLAEESRPRLDESSQAHITPRGPIASISRLMVLTAVIAVLIGLFVVVPGWQSFCWLVRCRPWRSPKRKRTIAVNVARRCPA